MTFNELLNKLQALDNGTNQWIARCPLHQPDEDNVSNWKLSISQGDTRPVVMFCYKCCVKGDTRNNVQVIDKISKLIGVDLLNLSYSEEVGRRYSSGGKEYTYDYNLIDAVYSDLIDQLDLTERHAKWLDKVGLNPDFAFALGYRSTPDDNSALLSKLTAKWKRDQLLQVPGFWLDGEKLQCTLRPKAVITPSRNPSRQVVCLKMRMLDGGAARMRAVGSGLRGGPKAIVNCHCPIGVGGTQWPTITVTEGERKADVYFQRTGQPVIGIPGIGLWEIALPLIQTLLSWQPIEQSGQQSSRSVRIALDQDGKKETKAVLERMAKRLTELNYKVEVLTWTGAKGIDDAVVKGAEIKVVQPCYTFSPPASLQLNKLADWEIVDYVKKCGRVYRCDLPLRHPNQDYVVGKLISKGELKIVIKDRRGQVLEATT